jgi:tetratricopeptide (TPR) repeat protein
MSSGRRRKTMSSTTEQTFRSAIQTLLILAAVCAAPAGWSQTKDEALIAQKPQVLQPAFRKLVEGGQRDSVLNNMEITTLALQVEHFDEAASAIDRALRDIERYFGLTPEALKARSLWYEEGSKTFKGEPYERAMAHYYRGMLDLRAGDFDNARAAFTSGNLQDAFAEEEQFQSDFSLLIFLSAWSAQLSGARSLAEDSYAQLMKLRPGFAAPPPEHDTLVIVETGKSPRKLADGLGHAELVYRRDKKLKELTVQLSVGDKALPILTEDIFFQASTRGGRQVDRILEGKVQFRNNTARAGGALTELGDAFSDVALATNDSQAGDLGAALSVVGSMQLLVAQNAKPRADTRYWSGLPDGIHVLTYSSAEHGTGPVEITYFDAKGTPLPDLKQVVGRIDTGKGAGLVWAISKH